MVCSLQHRTRPTRSLHAIPNDASRVAQLGSARAKFAGTCVPGSQLRKYVNHLPPGPLIARPARCSNPLLIQKCHLLLQCDCCTTLTLTTRSCRPRRLDFCVMNTVFLCDWSEVWLRLVLTVICLPVSSVSRSRVAAELVHVSGVTSTIVYRLHGLHRG